MNTKIIVIGAGASGIAASTKLLENGFENLTILEAENRIGGRISTVSFSSNFVELGAQWCHGEKGNVVYELAHKYDLFGVTKAAIEDLLIRSNSETIDKEVGQRLAALVRTIIGDLKYRIKNKISLYEGSVGCYVVPKYYEELKKPEYQDIDSELADQFIDFFQKYINSHDSSDSWFESSARTYLYYWECEGEHYLNWKKNKGYKTLLDILCKKYPDPSEALPIDDKILLNKIVNKISWNQSENSLIEVTCEDGSVYSADHVIVTMSLGVLKERHLSIFSPPLPIIKRNAIEGLSFGTVNKIFLEFNKSFWDEGWTGFSLLWTETDLEKIRKSDNPWLEYVHGIYTVDYQPNTLFGWVSGVYSRRMEQASDTSVREGMLYLLRNFLKKPNIPDPLRVKRSTWFTNTNFRGSYSFRSLGTDKTGTFADHLALPLKNLMGIEALQFAGEATHDHYYSTVHGAVETGWREATRIIDYYQKMKLTCLIFLLFFFAQIKRIKMQEFNNLYDTTIINNDNNHFDVLILGAGLSGLGAAVILSKTDKTFKILESQNRAGGRIKTVKLKVFGEDNQSSNISIEEGAQWLHSKDNYLYELAAQHNLLVDYDSEEGLGKYIRSDGYMYNRDFVKRIKLIVDNILEKCEVFAQNDNLTYPESVEKYLRDEFNIYLNEFNQNEQIIAKELLDWHIRFQIIDNSCLTLKELSAKSWGKYSLNGEEEQAHYNFRNGFNDLINVLINEIGQSNILYNNEIIHIDWKGKTENTNLPIIQVQTTSGNVYTANHVIITFSIGVLKTKLNEFTPKLPVIYSQTIEDLGFAAIGKIFLQWNEPWWGDLMGVQMLYNDTLYDEHWTRYVTGFDVIGPRPENTLLGWVGGYGVIQMEGLSDNEIVLDCVDILSRFTKLNVPAPSNYYISRWHSDRFAKGSYSFTTTTNDRHGTYNYDLLKPITVRHLKKINSDTYVQGFFSNISTYIENYLTNNHLPNNDNYPIILFAGEACHEQYFATAHGAFLTGIDQAQKILKYYSSPI